MNRYCATRPVRDSPLALAVLLAFSLVCPTRSSAQEAEPQVPPDIARMMDDGMTEALEARLAGGRTPDEKHWLAQAYGSKARRARQSDERRRASDEAAARYAAWVQALEPTAKGGGLSETIHLAAARVEYAGLMLSIQAAGELEEYEITAGRRGDRERLGRVLTAAREQYEKAAAAIMPIAESLSKHEQELIAEGAYDALIQTKLDMTFNSGWTSFYLGVLESDAARRRDLLVVAERRFQDLVDGGQLGTMRPQCYLALGMAQREQGRFNEADKNFARAQADDLPPALAARARYELARSQIQAEKFAEARTTLRPLVDKDPGSLSAGDQPARLYVNLAQLWDANSYLLEAETIRATARDSTAARTALLEKARVARETGLSKLKHLARRGGPWPGLVQIYVAASVDVKTPSTELSTLELLYTAGALLDAKRYPEALERLQEAAGREEADTNLAGDVLFESARCQYFLKNERAAAEGFSRLAAQFRSHAKAPQAATFAYGLWDKVAQRTKTRDDYLRLAATLRNLLESFADHPKRDEALWLLPAAMQLAGHFSEAAEEFAKVPPASKHWEQAQYRRAICGRWMLETARESLPADEYRSRARQAADGLLRYADEALKRGDSVASRAELAKWTADARIHAAELLVSAGVDDFRGAAAALAPFEKQPPETDALGRVLAVQIRAFRGLREFEQASKIVARYLQAAPPEQVGSTLASLAKGMQDEVERLLADGQTSAAKTLAADSLGTFDELEKWVRADTKRARNLDPVLVGRGRMLYLAGRYDEALRMASALLEGNPKSGNYQHLRALVLSAQLDDAATGERVRQAQDAWAALLADASIRQQAPERYWEARYNWLALALRLGDAADVETAITQERIWYPDLGGPTWAEKLEELVRQARAAQGKLPQTQSAAATRYVVWRCGRRWRTTSSTSPRS